MTEPSATPAAPAEMRRRTGLTTRDLHALDVACRLLDPAFDGHTYLVGTAFTGGNYRDVDVRTILPDEDFDRMFGHSPALWELVCFTVGTWLAQQSGLPVDYQIQRRTEANEKYSGKPRNPVGIGPTAREYAGLGDATNFKLAAAPGGTDPALVEAQTMTHREALELRDAAFAAGARSRDREVEGQDAAINGLMSRCVDLQRDLWPLREQVDKVLREHNAPDLPTLSQWMLNLAVENDKVQRP